MTGGYSIPTYWLTEWFLFFSEIFKKMCTAYGLDIEVTKIGFKNIAPFMITEDVLVGGEESGGIAVKGHIPESIMIMPSGKL